MNELMTAFQSMDTLLQAFWICALVASLVLVIQFVLMLIGIDHGDMDFDVHDGDTLDLGGSLNLFTVKNVIGFLVGFGWAGGYGRPIKNHQFADLTGILAENEYLVTLQTIQECDHNVDKLIEHLNLK